MKKIWRLKLIFGWLLAVWCSTVSTQIDSLKQVLEQTQVTSDQLRLHLALAQEYLGRDFDQAFHHIDQTLALAKDTSPPDSVLYESYFTFARLGIYTSSRLEEGEAYMKQAITLAREHLKDIEKEAKALNVLAIFKELASQSDQAIVIFEELIELTRRVELTYSEGSAYQNLGSVYYRRSDNESAAKYFRKAIDVFVLLDNQEEVARGYGGLGAVTEQLDSAIYYLETAIQINREIGAPVFAQATQMTQLANRYFLAGEYELAKEWYWGTARYSQQINDQAGYHETLLHLGQCHLYQDNLDSACYYVQLVKPYSDEVNDIPQQQLVYDLLSRCQAANGAHAAAYESLRNSFTLKDSIYSTESTEALAEFNVRYETTEKEAQIARQQLEIAQQQNQRNRLLLGGVVLLALVGGVYQYNYSRQRQQKREVELALATEAREAERLRHIDLLKTNFFTNVSHELRTPLTLITSPLQEALGKVKQVNLQSDLQLAHQNSQRLLGLINEILDLSKLEAGALTIEEADIDLLPFLRRVFYSFQSAADLHEVTLQWQAPAELDYRVRTDVPKLEKILNNLISNAIKFTPPVGTVRLAILPVDSTGNQKPQLQLQVTDTGPGIHPDDIPYIFNRFYQSSQQQPQGGTGIGLSLSKQLAQLLGGDLSVQSEWQKGSTFSLDLPLEVVAESLEVVETEEALVSDEVPSIAPPLVFRAGRPQVLIVEDNQEMANYLLQKLRPDYDCHLAENGEEALRLLTQQPFDLITSDVMMPVMDGFALRERINNNPDWRRIPFLLLTARTLEADKIRGFQLGIDDYVTKPFSVPELQARIRNLLENKLGRDTAEPIAAQELDPNQQLLAAAEQLIRERLDDPAFTVEELAKAMGQSQRNLARIFNQLTGLSPVKFILEVRLQHARHLLEKRQFSTVAEVRYEVGIESRSYFTNKFKQRFGKSPKAYLEEVLAVNRNDRADE